MAERRIEPRDPITAEFLNAIPFETLRLLRAGPGISIKRSGVGATISALRSSSGGGSAGRENHHVVSTFSQFASLSNDEEGDIGIATTDNVAAMRLGNGSSTEWERITTCEVTTDETPTTPAGENCKLWVDEYNERILGNASSAAGTKWYPLNYIGPVET